MVTTLQLEPSIATPITVNSLPSEILSAIFAAVAHPVRSNYTLAQEIIISHVCQHWRNIALNDSSMWTHLDIYSNRCSPRITAYLERSNTCSVDLRFDLWHWDRKIGTPGWLDHVVDATVRSIDRWRSLLVFAYYKSTTNAILSRIADLSAPMLQQIRIIDDGEGSGEAVAAWEGRIVAGGAPNLVLVQMDRAHYLPLFAHITTLHLRSTYASPFKLNTDVVAGLSRACPSLSVLSIHGSFGGNEIEWATSRPPSVTMRYLRSIWFCHETSGGALAACYFLMTVSLPQLVSLWLDLGNHHLRVLHLLGSHSFRPAFPSLKHLTLQRFDFYPMPDVVKLFPNVQAVHFAYCKAFFIQFLKRALCMDQPSWTQLETLVFRTTCERHAQNLVAVLREIVQRRLALGAPIRRLILDKDLLESLPATNSTPFEQLTATNFDDPWWVVQYNAHDDMFP